MRDEQGNLITGKREIQEQSLKYYQKVLENRKISEDLKDHKEAREELAKKRMESASLNRTEDWTMDKLEKILKALKKNKSRDPHGFINELFRPGVIGNDLKKSLLMLLNRIKMELSIPAFMQFVNIVAI